jgi:hypothetical protein
MPASPLSRPVMNPQLHSCSDHIQNTQKGLYIILKYETMKKHIIAIAASLAIIPASAQMQFGVKGGVNLAHVSSNQPEVDNHKKTWTTFHAGLIADFAASEHFSFQPHVLIQGKGTRLKYDSVETKVRFISLDIPLNLVYKSNGFFIGAGPNLGFNLDVNSKTNGTVVDTGIGSDEDEVRRFDFGINFLAGYKTDFGLLVGVNYLRGLSNLDNTPDADWRNHAFGISLGFLFGEKFESRSKLRSLD